MGKGSADYGEETSRTGGRHGLLAGGFVCLAGERRVVGEWVKGLRIMGKRPHGRHGLLAGGFVCLAGERRVVGEWVKGLRIALIVLIMGRDRTDGTDFCFDDWVGLRGDGRKKMNNEDGG
jgi:hypothetical protein